ncbi:MAG: 3-isopropylmalate dehydratase small subunit [Alphaproteobacteria bacterium]|nr:3-isopropylmalate dehydratase small subunit [Alphaproteobacteria bacterium]
MKISGNAHLVGDHIDTDQIIPSKFLGTTDPAALRSGCFLNLIPDFAGTVASGDVLVAGDNFGCGSSREHAPIAIKATGIACVVAASFSRIFFRSAINIGLPAVVCPAAVGLINDGDPVSVNLDFGTVTVAGRSHSFEAFAPQVLDILAAGGLTEFLTRTLARERGAA